MRVIDADRLKEHIDKLPVLPDGNFAGNHSALKALINMQPTVDPGRKPGKWIDVPQYSGILFECDFCHKYQGTIKYKYCPNCGAKMEVDG